MARTKSNPLKAVGIIILAIILCACIAIDSWYIYIKKFGEKKLVSNTYEIGLQETTNGDTKYFAEINYFSNEQNNGLEMLEIKFNYMLDENKESFFSQGLQFVADDKNSTLKFEYKVDSSHPKEDPTCVFTKGLYNEYVYNRYGGYELTSGKKNNYSSSNDYETTTVSTNPINADTGFKIEVGEDLFLMKFRGKDTRPSQASFISSYVAKKTTFVKDMEYYYAYFDINFFSELIYRVLKSVTPGTNSAIVFEFGDLFDYYKYDIENHVYSDKKYEGCDIVIQQLRSYYVLKINVSENGARRSSDSLFNVINCNSSFNISNDYSGDDYFIGRTVVNLNEYDFDYINIEGNNYAIKLKQSVLNFYKNFDVWLDIVLDLDNLKANNINYVGLANDNSFGNLKIFSFKTIETIDHEIVERVVEV